MISFAAGVPNPKTFPFKSCSFTLKDGTEIEFSPKQLDDALQYTATPGLPELLEWVVNHQISEFKPALDKSKWSCIITTGSQDGLSKCFECLVDENDCVLMENRI